MSDAPYRLFPGRPRQTEDPAPTKRSDLRLPEVWIPLLEAIAKAKGDGTRHALLRRYAWEGLIREARELGLKLPED